MLQRKHYLLPTRCCLCCILQPAVAFANIGELAVDVLICTLKAQLIARLDDDNILACVGNNAFCPQPAGFLTTALELYHVPGQFYSCNAGVYYCTAVVQCAGHMLLILERKALCNGALGLVLRFAWGWCHCDAAK